MAIDECVYDDRWLVIVDEMAGAWRIFDTQRMGYIFKIEIVMADLLIVSGLIASLLGICAVVFAICVVLTEKKDDTKMKTYKIAVIITVSAKSYEDAFAQMSEDVEVGALHLSDYENTEVFSDFEVDDDGNRTLILSAEDDDEMDENEENEAAAE